jgi:hypothetical protein
MADWIPNAAMTLVALSQLEEDWDSHGGFPSEPCALGSAVQFLGAAANTNWPEPHIVPCSRGNIQFEWSVPEVEFAIAPSDKPHAFASGLVGDDEVTFLSLKQLCKHLSEVFGG